MAVKESTTDSVPVSKKSSSLKCRRRAWVIVLAGSMNYALLLGLSRAMGIFTVELMDVFEAPATEVSTLFSTFGISFTVSALLLNTALGGIFHERALVVIGTTFGCLGFVIPFFGTNLETITIGVGFCSGFGAQTLATSSQSLVSKYFKNRLSLAVGLVILGGSVGGFIWPVLLRFLFDEFTLRGASLIIASIVLNGYVCAAVMRPFDEAHRQSKFNQLTGRKSVVSVATTSTTSPVQTRENLAFVEDEFSTPKQTEISNDKMATDVSWQSTPNESTETARNSTDGESLRRIKEKDNFMKKFIFVAQNGRKHSNSKNLSAVKLLTSPEFYFFQLYTWLFGTGLQYIILFYPAITEDLGFRQYQSAIFLSAIGISSSIAQLLLGFVGDHISNRKVVVILSHVVLASSTFFCQRADSFWPQIICAAAIGLSLIPSFLYRLPMIRDIFGEKVSPKMLSLNLCASGLGIIGGGPLFGWLRDSSGGYTLPGYVAVAVLLSGCALLAIIDLLRRKLCRKSEIYNLDVN